MKDSWIVSPICQAGIVEFALEHESIQNCAHTKQDPTSDNDSIARAKKILPNVSDIDSRKYEEKRYDNENPFSGLLVIIR